MTFARPMKSSTQKFAIEFHNKVLGIVRKLYKDLNRTVDSGNANSHRLCLGDNPTDSKTESRVCIACRYAQGWRIFGAGISEGSEKGRL